MTSTSAAIPSAWTGTRGWVTTGVAAKRLGYTDRHMRRLCVDGRIPGARRTGSDGDWRIPLEWMRSQIVPVVVRRKPEGEE